MTESVRLAKRVAAMVPCSRREAELYIEGGWVRVNGVVIEEPQHRVADEQVEIDSNATLDAMEPVTLLLHKPAGASESDALQLLAAGTRAPTGETPFALSPSKGETPFALSPSKGLPGLRQAQPERNPDHRSASREIRPVKRHFLHLTSLMPLPAQASGLAVFSQEQRIIRRLTEDAMTMEQELVVEVAGELAPEGLARLGHGLAFEGRALPPIKVSWQNETRLRFAMKGIAPQMVPWMCEQVGLRVLGVKRLRIGRLPMAGLPAGQWRYLLPQERF